MRRAHHLSALLSRTRSPQLEAVATTATASRPPSPGADALRAWSCRWGTPDELLLLSSSHREAEHLNHLARAALTAAGRLGGPTVRAGELDLAAGDRVVAGPGGIGRPGGRGIPEGCLGDVRMVDTAGRWVVVDFPTAGVVRLAGADLQRVRLRYGYAVDSPSTAGLRRATRRPPPGPPHRAGSRDR